MEWIQGLAPAGLVIWLAILLLPWRPWGTRESLDTRKSIRQDLSTVTVLIPARNEAAVISRTLLSLSQQEPDLKIIVVDDQSTDDTAGEINRLALKNLVLIQGEPAPPGWSGKLWALEQARQRADTEILLLLDADIELLPNMIATLKDKFTSDELHLLSLMANLRMRSFWEILLIPAFIYFFKLLYPFHLSNTNNRWIAAAAGGCIMLRSDSLQCIGGFTAIRGALIDDCTLAKSFRVNGYKTWIGLTHSATSLRTYNNLSGIWYMVTRTAFTQLRYSWIALLLCIGLMSVAFVSPVINLIAADVEYQWMSGVTFIIMFTTYLPVLRYYEIPVFWSLTLPLAGLLYLLMTCDSAWLHISGRGSSWKGRTYGKTPSV